MHFFYWSKELIALIEPSIELHISILRKPKELGIKQYLIADLEKNFAYLLALFFLK